MYVSVALLAAARLPAIQLVAVDYRVPTR
jgi:hypothetical protein